MSVTPSGAPGPDLRLLDGEETLLAIEVKTNNCLKREQLDRYAGEFGNLAVLVSLGDPNPKFIQAAIPDRRYPILLLEHIFAWIDKGDPLGGSGSKPPKGADPLKSLLQSAIDEVADQMRVFVGNHSPYDSFPMWARTQKFDLEYFTKGITEEYLGEASP